MLVCYIIKEYKECNLPISERKFPNYRVQYYFIYWDNQEFYEMPISYFYEIWNFYEISMKWNSALKACDS